MKLFRFLVRCSVAAVFLVAGTLKASHPGQFIRDIWNYHLVAEPYAYWIAAALPYLEIVAALALATGRLRRGAHWILGPMLAVFIVALAAAWWRGLEISCGCFGSASSGEATNYPWDIVRDLILLAAIIASARWDHTAQSNADL